MNKQLIIDLSEDRKWYIFKHVDSPELTNFYLRDNTFPAKRDLNTGQWRTWFETLKTEHILMLEGLGWNVEFTNKANKLFNLVSGELVQEISFDFKNVNTNYDGISLPLFPYQGAAVKCLDLIIDEELGLGAFLCDQMGLGKCVEILTYLVSKNEKGLIVCPNNAKNVWEREIKKFTNKSYAIIDSFSSDGDWQNALSSDFVVINYELTHRRFGELQQVATDRVLIADEGHEIRNTNTKKCFAVLALGLFVKYSIVVTGTAIWNKEIDLIPLLQLTNRNWIKHKTEFIRRYCDSVVGNKQLKEKLKPFTIRRLRNEVEIQMPSKTWDDRFVSLDNQNEYDYAEKNFIEWVEEKYGRNKADSALRAQAIVYLNRMRELSATGKFNSAVEFIDECLDNDEPVIMFACHIKILEMLKDYYGDEARLYIGGMKRSDKCQIENEFNDNKFKVFLGSMMCAKQALSLTGGSVVGMLNYPWSPQTLLQASDRPCRVVGQKASNISIYKLMAKGIDVKMNSILAPKIEKSDIITGDDEKIGDLNKSILIDVLSLYGMNLYDDKKDEGELILSQSGYESSYLNW